jgi:hypothetical protein
VYAAPRNFVYEVFAEQIRDLLRRSSTWLGDFDDLLFARELGGRGATRPYHAKASSAVPERRVLPRRGELGGWGATRPISYSPCFSML